MNGGTCHDSETLDTFVCKCAQGYEGETCEQGTFSESTIESISNVTYTYVIGNGKPIFADCNKEKLPLLEICQML